MKKINKKVWLIIILILMGMVLCGCSIKDNEKSSIKDKIKEEIEYIENKILTFFIMFAKEEYGDIEDLNWDLIEENVIDLNGVLDTVILDMSEVEISNEEIITFKDTVNRLSIATSNKDINVVLEEYRLLYAVLPMYAQKAFDNKNEVKQLELKSLVISSFVYANLLNWEEANEMINIAETKYKEMMDDIDYMKEYSYNLNKILVLLSELRNAINIEEAELVKLKYVNFIEKI